MSEHLQSDLWNYAAFLAGQLLFLLKRAGAAIRDPNADIKRRRDYFKQNWDTWGIRATVEFPFFYGWKHYGLATITGFFGWTPPQWFVLPDNPLTAFFLGYAADSLLDWLSMSPKLPSFVRNWIGENVPQMPGVKKLQDTLDTAAAATKEAGDAISKAQEIGPNVKP